MVTVSLKEARGCSDVPVVDARLQVGVTALGLMERPPPESYCVFNFMVHYPLRPCVFVCPCVPPLMPIQTRAVVLLLPRLCSVYHLSLKEAN